MLFSFLEGGRHALLPPALLLPTSFPPSLPPCLTTQAPPLPPTTTAQERDLSAATPSRRTPSWTRRVPGAWQPVDCAAVRPLLTREGVQGAWLVQASAMSLCNPPPTHPLPPGAAQVAFTGSTSVGRTIMAGEGPPEGPPKGPPEGPPAARGARPAGAAHQVGPLSSCRRLQEPEARDPGGGCRPPPLVRAVHPATAPPALPTRPSPACAARVPIPAPPPHPAPRRQLGGNSPVVVCDDADVEAAAKGAHYGGRTASQPAQMGWWGGGGAWVGGWVGGGGVGGLAGPGAGCLQSSQLSCGHHRCHYLMFPPPSPVLQLWASLRVRGAHLCASKYQGYPPPPTHTHTQPPIE